MEKPTDKPIRARVVSGQDLDLSERSALRLLRLLERLEAREREEAKRNGEPPKE
jgi:hypothetical protein